MKRHLWLFGAVAVCAAAGALYSQEEKEAPKADVEVTVVGVEYRGTKMWLPGTIFAKKGQRIKVNVVNKIPGEGTTHGFAIDRFGVKKVIAVDAAETIEFTADEAGIFPLYCHQHPAHVGGQVVVLED